VATPARQAAFALLLELERGRASLGDLLARPEANALDPRERSFLHELVLGTLRQRGRLDHALQPLLARGVEHTDPAALAALRLGAFQMLQTRVPPHAAVAESVALARQATPRTAGLVNAVLRRLARDGPPSEPDLRTEPLAWLTSHGSLPQWLAERWLARLGAERAVARARAALQPAPVAFRVNPRRPPSAEDMEGLDAQPLPVPGAFLARAGRTQELAGQGRIYVQDEGSQLIARLLAGPGRTLDACAAPGGKTLLLADLAGPAGQVVACESSPRRARSLAAVVRRWAAPAVSVVCADAARAPFARTFDRVLLDAPCSGLGTLGRHPDLRWRVTPADLARQAARQAGLLHALAPLVAPGGLLLYATCSLEREENEAVVDGFVEWDDGFARASLPDWAAPWTDGSCLRRLPERDGGDGFYAALLRRTGPSPVVV
jgi:16S rRNA (cytosine967-C5)-methyltransferase